MFRFCPDASGKTSDVLKTRSYLGTDVPHPKGMESKQIQVFMLVLLTIHPTAHKEAVENAILSFC